MSEPSGDGPSSRRVSPRQSNAAIAAFLIAHPHEICGEQVDIERLGRFVGMVCESCGEERVLEVVAEHEEQGGGV